MLNQSINQSINQKTNFISLIKKIVKRILRILKKTKSENKSEKIGKFRLGGEVHQWMYDRYSLKKLLQEIGFSNIEQKDAFSSSILDWEEFSCLDIKNGETRKPDSIFFEAKK